MNDQKLQEIIDKINAKAPLGIKDIAISVAFVTALGVAYGVSAYQSYQTEGELLRKEAEMVQEDDDIVIPSTNPQTIGVETNMSASDNNESIPYYTEIIDPVAYAAPEGPVQYVVPDGYELKTITDENGIEKVVGEKTR